MQVLTFSISFFRPDYKRLRALFFQLFVVSLLFGCASTKPQTEADNTHYEDRVITLEEGGVKVSTSALSVAESLTVYGVPLASKKIQPVWIEVENNEDVTYWLLSPGVDPNFFPASEAADVFKATAGAGEIEKRFQELTFHNPVPPGGKVSGFVLTNLDEGLKMIQIDLVASGHLRSFSFLTEVPGFHADYHSKGTISDAYPENEIIDYTDDDAFRAALEAYPCCVTNKNSTKNGDPLNLVVIGGLEDAFPALVRRGWRPTEQTTKTSILKMINSVMSGERYLYSPISPLYLFGRPQDLALQKARDSIHQRNHLRLWLAPIRYHGKLVWVGRISRDIGSRLTIHSPYLTTHKIDPDVDEALTALVEDMTYSQSLVKIGLVKGVGAATKEQPRENLTTDPYFTNGLRGVLIFDEHPTSLTEIQFLPWEGTEAGGMIEQSVKGNSNDSQ